MIVPYERGLHEVADDVWAWLQPDGGWGWSNSGLIASDGESLLVDTLFDLDLTAAMLREMRKVVMAASPIDTVVNTHANGDHTYGNQLLPGAEIIASEACAAEFEATTPEVMQGFLDSAPNLGALGEYVEHVFGAFDFTGITLMPPTRTFRDAMDVRLGRRTVQLIELGPAHTKGDVIAWLPDAEVVFTGDLLFNGGHPIVWAGPIAGWIEACDRIVGLAPAVVVPGHGPVTDGDAVRRMGDYFRWLQTEARKRRDGGQSALEAATDLHQGLADTPFGEWGESERLVINVTAAYRDLGEEVADDVVTMFTQMAELAMSPAG